MKAAVALGFVLSDRTRVILRYNCCLSDRECETESLEVDRTGMETVPSDQIEYKLYRMMIIRDAKHDQIRSISIRIYQMLKVGQNGCID